MKYCAFFFSVRLCLSCVINNMHVLMSNVRFMHTVLIPIVPYCIYVYLYIPSFTVLCPVFLPACHTTGLA